ncbi:methyl-accepting chemotaxis sensory transducer with TarH sensor [Duganella sp. CF458]|uniref:methyl-accepting chemotaxis protein n=1 Tax=Duganella sp. CF458 TaxID=1884368 RepID=UPI0008F193ED|nr:methyl-accepting chemotaxis protein [Duganella sp. CF458]SFG80450.1 methyl-accepting chemotaxis sensory transducer with TarH sensor [Duganella sp. CF458]
MFKNLLIKWKLAVLVAVMMLALAVLGIAGYGGIAKVGESVNEIGVVRLPSIHGLLVLSEGQTAVDKATLSTAIYENDYQAQAKFADVAKARDAAWAKATAGWKKYEPLPQTAEEAVMWKQFVGEWEAWKAADAKLGGIVSALAGNQDEAKQKEMFAQFFQQYQASGPLFSKAEQTLNKIIELNDNIAKDSIRSGSEAVVSAERVMVITAVVAMALAIAIAWYIALAITRPIESAVKVAQTVAAGDLTSDISVETSEETGQLLQALKDMNESLIRVVGQVRKGTGMIGSATSEIATGNMDLSSRTEEQASSLEETASSMEELTSTVRHNSDNALQANQLAKTASTVAAKGGEVVARVVETMDSINESSSKIVDIISVIDGIAFQTNILALNAAVEAARAGEQGRGFAVVASEVRNLAQRSAAAAKEIKQLIGDSVEKVGAGSRLVGEAGATMGEVVTSVQRVTDIISEISLATQEQSAGIDQINTAISQMDHVTQQNAALVEEAAAASAALEEQAARLMEVVSVFKLDPAAVAAMGAEAPARRPSTQARALAVARPARGSEQRAARRSELQAAAGAAPGAAGVDGSPGLRAETRRPATAAGKPGDDWEEF